MPTASSLEKIHATIYSRVVIPADIVPTLSDFEPPEKRGLDILLVPIIKTGTCESGQQIFSKFKFQISKLIFDQGGSIFTLVETYYHLQSENRAYRPDFRGPLTEFGPQNGPSVVKLGKIEPPVKFLKSLVEGSIFQAHGSISAGITNLIIR